MKNAALGDSESEDEVVCLRVNDPVQCDLFGQADHFQLIDGAWQYKQAEHLSKLSSDKESDFTVKKVTVQSALRPIQIAIIRSLPWPIPSTKVVKIHGDGNCFFRALSYAVFGTQRHHALLRQLTIETMHRNWDVVVEQAIDRYCGKKKIPKPTDDSYKTWLSVTEYLSCLNTEKDKEWAGDAEITAATMLLDTNICSYTTNRRSKGWRYYPDSGKKLGWPGPSLVLYHTDLCHFSFVEYFGGVNLFLLNASIFLHFKTFYQVFFISNNISDQNEYLLAAKTCPPFLELNSDEGV
jgi:hypothetical protein